MILFCMNTQIQLLLFLLAFESLSLKENQTLLALLRLYGFSTQKFQRFFHISITIISCRLRSINSLLP
ncbi:hypothetical protein Peur_029670 [Populus x canadensis]